MRRAALLCFLSAIISLPISLEAQGSNKEDLKQKEKRIDAPYRNNLSTHIGAFDPWFGVSYEKSITPYLGIDVAIGIIGASAGIKVYYPRLSEGNFSFYTGISEGILLLVGPKHYIPFGATYLWEKGFRISLDVGPQIYHDRGETNEFGLVLKVGQSF